VRNPVQVARSLNRRDGLPRDMGERRWFNYTIEILHELREHAICVIEYERWFDDMASNAARLVRFLGLEPGSTPIATVVAPIIDAKLPHSDPTLEDTNQPLVAALYQAVRRIDADPTTRAKAAQIVDQSRAFQELNRSLEREFEAISHPLLPLAQVLREPHTAI